MSVQGTLYKHLKAEVYVPVSRVFLIQAAVTVVRGAEAVVYDILADRKLDVCNATLMCTILIAEYSQYLEFYFIYVK